MTIFATEELPFDKPTIIQAKSEGAKFYANVGMHVEITAAKILGCDCPSPNTILSVLRERATGKIVSVTLTHGGM